MNTIDRIRAEIERMISAHKTKNGFPKGSFCAVRIEAYNEVLGLLATLEEPDKDLDEEYKEYVDNDPVYSRLVNHFAGMSIARHFYELGKNSK